MDNNFRYFNAFFIIIILTSLIGAFKYFFYDNPNKESFHKDPYKKILQKNYFSHILYICDNYFFVQNKKIECNKEKEEYLFLIEKLFNIIEETLKYKLEIISINLMSLTDLTLMPPEEIKNIINNKKLWKIIQKNSNKMNINI